MMLGWVYITVLQVDLNRGTYLKCNNSIFTSDSGQNKESFLICRSSPLTVVELDMKTYIPRTTFLRTMLLSMSQDLTVLSGNRP